MPAIQIKPQSGGRGGRGGRGRRSDEESESPSAYDYLAHGAAVGYDGLTRGLAAIPAAAIAISADVGKRQMRAMELTMGNESADEKAYDPTPMDDFRDAQEAGQEVINDVTDVAFPDAVFGENAGRPVASVIPPGKMGPAAEGLYGALGAIGELAGTGGGVTLPFKGGAALLRWLGKGGLSQIDNLAAKAGDDIFRGAVNGMHQAAKKGDPKAIKSFLDQMHARAFGPSGSQAAKEAWALAAAANSKAGKVANLARKWRKLRPSHRHWQAGKWGRFTASMIRLLCGKARIRAG